MTRDYDFEIGQNVKVWDHDLDEYIPGKVVDKTRDTVMIRLDKYNGPNGYTEYERWQFENIKILTNTKKKR